MFRRIFWTSWESIAQEQILRELSRGWEIREDAVRIRKLVGSPTLGFSRDRKFDRGFKALLGTNQFSNSLNDNRAESFGEQALRTTRRLLPWALGIYVADIPLPFMKRAFPGVDLDKSFAFTQWVRSGMPWDFDPNKKVDTWADTLNNLKWLRAILATATSYTVASKNVVPLWQVTQKVRLLITTYMLKRFWPDAEILKSSTQNVFENVRDGIELLDLLGIWEWIRAAVDKKSAGDLLKNIMKDCRSWRVDFNKVFQLEEILSANDRSWGLFGIWAWESAMYIDAFRNRNAYMSGVQRQWDVLDRYIAAIYNWEQAFKATQQEDLRPGSRIPDALPDAKFRTLKRWVYGDCLDVHWSGPEVLASLRGVRPIRNDKKDSLGWILNNMRHLDKDLDIRGLSYDDLAAWIARWKMVPMEEFEPALSVINTSVSWKRIQTNIIWLMKQKGDTHIFKAPIEYTTKDGQRVKYTLYLRPDCSNFMMLPDQFDMRGFGATNFQLPIVVPWNLLFPPTHHVPNVPKVWTIKTRPWEDGVVITTAGTHWINTGWATWWTIVTWNPLAL